MLKKLAIGGTLAAFAVAGIGAPAMAATPWPQDQDLNTSTQSGNVVVCGNSTIGDIFIGLLTLAPVTVSKKDPVDCSIRVYQN
ncbi:hypothetical protein [Spongiactinospora sp. TRM90649]|uniref:hypothetical protein n=1 Tax=Spongiactinospora sp. TRM90649 TaxID=3031114 RepID=UPI0023F94040|nr:hypothetical protein [Spongiactinospora sp. TRM90649]MDF5751463.1 hypothetical protein [Spongiactinospora sp. TRM90649]